MLSVIYSTRGKVGGVDYPVFVYTVISLAPGHVGQDVTWRCGRAYWQHDCRGSHAIPQQILDQVFSGLLRRFEECQRAQGQRA
ncbi:hypothetical protein J6590_067313 [Homalodisca vitripennis]|nr:hypothetical protein J6590_067313 [Homalodisca vitripennis]